MKKILVFLLLCKVGSIFSAEAFLEGKNFENRFPYQPNEYNSSYDDFSKTLNERPHEVRDANTILELLNFDNEGLLDFYNYELNHNNVAKEIDLYLCPYCEANPMNQYDLAWHIKNHFDQLKCYQCSHCVEEDPLADDGEYDMTEEEFKKHLQEVHGV